MSAQPQSVGDVCVCVYIQYIRGW